MQRLASRLPPELKSARSVLGRAFSTAPALRQSPYRRFGDPRLTFPSAASGGAGRGPRRNFQVNLRSPVVWIIGGGAGAYYIAHLEKEPHTGRYRFIDVNPEEEKQMGLHGVQEVNSEFRGRILPDSHPTARFVRSVARRIVQANGLDADGTKWDCHVVEDPNTKNAFVLPGGHIFVFTGILGVSQDADGLAVVLGHEIAHQVLRHSAERMSSMKVLFVLSWLLTSLGLDLGFSRVILNLIMTLPNSRKSEGEADSVGLQLSNKACFDPRAAAPLWDRMDSGEAGASGKKGNVNLSFLSTHPSSSSRSENLAKLAQELLDKRPAGCGPLARQYENFQHTGRSFFR